MNLITWDAIYISYCERKEVNNKENKFKRMCDTISIILKGKTKLSTQIKFYKVMF